MIKLLTGARVLVTRIVGVRKLGHEIDGRLRSTHVDLAGRLDSLLAEVIAQHQFAEKRARAFEERLDCIHDTLARQSGTASARDETIQNQLSDLRGRTEIAQSSAYDQGIARVLGEVRAEFLVLRADLAREAEERDGRA